MRILVVLQGSWPGVLETIRVASKTAYQPQRLVFALVVRGVEQAAAERLLMGVCARVHVYPDHLDLGPQVLRDLCLRTHFRNERYLLLLHGATARHWDRVLVESLAVAYAQGLHLLSGSGLTFPVLDAAQTEQQRVPVYRGRAFQRTPSICYPVPISASLVFGESKILLPLLQTPVPMVSPAEDDFILSALCFADGARAGTPLAAVQNEEKITPDSPPPPNAALRQYKDDVIRLLLEGGEERKESLLVRVTRHGAPVDAYAQKLQVRLEPLELPGHLVLGVSRDPTPQETREKYGTEYMQYRERFCID